MLQANFPYKNIKYYSFKLKKLCRERMCKLITQKTYSGLARYPILSKTTINSSTFSEQDLSSDLPKL